MTWHVKVFLDGSLATEGPSTLDELRWNLRAIVFQCRRLADLNHRIVATAELGNMSVILYPHGETSYGFKRLEERLTRAEQS